MPYQISEPIDIPHVQRMLDALTAEIDAREQAATVLATQNAELHDALQRRLAESESFGRRRPSWKGSGARCAPDA